MLWFYSQEDAKATITTSYDNRTEEYVLVVNWSDCRREEERFARAIDFKKRLVEIEKQLAAMGLRQDRPPTILPYGWPDRRPAR